MSLRRVHAEDGGRVVRWNIEAPTVGVILIDVVVGEGSAPLVPLYWRAGTWLKPPLELWLDKRGRLLGLQFVLQDERVPAREWFALPVPDEALPVFDTGEWPSERYLDEKTPVMALHLPRGELALVVGDPQPSASSCRVGPGLVMGFGEAADLLEIRLGPLGEEDWASIDAFSFVQ